MFDGCFHFCKILPNFKTVCNLEFFMSFFKQRMLLEVVLFVLIKSRPSRADYLCHMGFFRTYVVSFEIRK